MIHAAFFLARWWHYFYAPNGQPWYQGAVWSNFFVIPIIAISGYVWSKTKFWPLSQTLGAIKALHLKVDAHIQHQREHNEWMARHIARMHLAQTGKSADVHPHFGDLDKTEHP